MSQNVYSDFRSSYSLVIALISIFLLQLRWTNHQVFFSVRYQYTDSSLGALMLLDLLKWLVHKKIHNVLCGWLRPNHPKWCNIIQILYEKKEIVKNSKILDAIVFSNRHSRKGSKSWATIKHMQRLLKPFASKRKTLRQFER